MLGDKRPDRSASAEDRRRQRQAELAAADAGKARLLDASAAEGERLTACMPGARPAVSPEAEALARRMREYTPDPPHENRIFKDLSREAQDFVRRLAEGMVKEEWKVRPRPSRGRPFRPRRSEPPTVQPAADRRYRERRALRLASRQAHGIEALEGLLRAGFEQLAQRDGKQDARERVMVRLALASAGFGAMGAVAAVVAIFT